LLSPSSGARLSDFLILCNAVGSLDIADTAYSFVISVSHEAIDCTFERLVPVAYATTARIVELGHFQDQHLALMPKFRDSSDSYAHGRYESELMGKADDSLRQLVLENLASGVSWTRRQLSLFNNFVVRCCSINELSQYESFQVRESAMIACMQILAKWQDPFLEATNVTTTLRWNDSVIYRTIAFDSDYSDAIATGMESMLHFLSTSFVHESSTAWIRAALPQLQRWEQLDDLATSDERDISSPPVMQSIHVADSTGNS
jgi:hypothetical protein